MISKYGATRKNTESNLYYSDIMQYFFSSRSATAAHARLIHYNSASIVKTSQGTGELEFIATINIKPKYLVESLVYHRKSSICRVSFIARFLFPIPDKGSLKIHQNEE